MKKYRIEIIGMTETERAEYLVDCVVCDTYKEAIQIKREMFGPDGIWSGCDVYAKISEIDNSRLDAIRVGELDGIGG